MPKYKLTYFDGRGLAEVCRILFVAAGQEFEDVRVTQEEWPNIKPNIKFGKIPILEFDGKVYAQSTAIANYLAREFGFYGKTNEEGLQIDQVTQLINDIFEAARKSFTETDEAKRLELLKNFEEVETPKFLGFFEQLLKESGTGYFVGNSMTLADIAVQVAADGFNRRKPGCLESFPLLRALCEKVESNEKIKVYLANRKETPF